MKIYFDIETDEYVTEKQLFDEYKQAKKEDSTIDYDFTHYVNNCLTINNGSLYTVKQKIEQLKNQVDILVTEQKETGFDNQSDIDLLNRYINVLRLFD